MSNDYGIHATALDYFKSFITDRTYSVQVGSNSSKEEQLKFGVSQGTLLSVSLYIIATNRLCNLPSKFNIKSHYYSDDIFLWVSFEIDDDMDEI